MSSKKSDPKPVSPATALGAQGKFQGPWLAFGILFLMAFLLYGNTLRHDYALDDSIVITDNQFTKMGTKGLGYIFTTDAFEGFFKGKRDLVTGGRYRPLSMATFAVEWQLFSKKDKNNKVTGNPMISHLGNVILYGALGVCLFALLTLMLPAADTQKWWLSLPFWLTLLFMAHPIHTEVVANIKGRDELMALLFLVLTMWLSFLYIDRKQAYLLALAGGSFFLALLSKETAFPFIALVPFSLWFFRANRKFNEIILASAPVWIAFGLYLLIRLVYVPFGLGSDTQKIVEILNDPFIHASFSERVATVMETWGIYLYKLLLPIKLSHDYYFNEIPITSFSDPLVLLSLALNVGLAGIGLYLSKSRNPIGYGIVFYFLSFSITSNLLVSIGTTMGERFVFVPSLGFLIAMVFGIVALLKRMKINAEKPIAYIGLVLLALFSLKTIGRNAAWKDNYTLFTTDAENSPNSAKVQTAAGGVMIERAEAKGTGPMEKTKLYEGAIQHLQKAVKIYPEHGSAWMLLGNAQFGQGNYQLALQSYQTAFNRRSELWDAYRNAAVAARKMKRYDLASQFYKLEINRKKQLPKPIDIDAKLWFDYANNFEEWGTKPDSAIYAYLMALNVDPQMAMAYGQMGRVYGMQLNQLDKAIEYGEKAVAIDPKLDWVYENIGIAKVMRGEQLEAIEVFKRGLQANPNNFNLHKNLGLTYQNLGDLVNAEASFAKAAQLNPNGK